MGLALGRVRVDLNPRNDLQAAAARGFDSSVYTFGRVVVGQRQYLEVTLDRERDGLNWCQAAI